MPAFSSGRSGRRAFPPTLERSTEPLHVTVSEMGGGTSALGGGKGVQPSKVGVTMGNHVVPDRSGQGRKAGTTGRMKRAAKVTPLST